MQIKTVKNLLDKKLVSLNLNAKASTAKKLMDDTNIDILPVLEDGKLVGVFTADSYEKCAIGLPTQSVKDVMKKPLFVEKESGVDSAIKYMLRHRLSRIPVVDSSITMKCIGIVSSSELLKEKKKENKRN